MIMRIMRTRWWQTVGFRGNEMIFNFCVCPCSIASWPNLMPVAHPSKVGTKKMMIITIRRHLASIASVGGLKVDQFSLLFRIYFIHCFASIRCITGPNLPNSPEWVSGGISLIFGDSFLLQQMMIADLHRPSLLRSLTAPITQLRAVRSRGFTSMFCQSWRLGSFQQKCEKL